MDAYHCHQTYLLKKKKKIYKYNKKTNDLPKIMIDIKR